MVCRESDGAAGRPGLTLDLSLSHTHTHLAHCGMGFQIGHSHHPCVTYIEPAREREAERGGVGGGAEGSGWRVRSCETGREIRRSLGERDTQVEGIRNARYSALSNPFDPSTQLSYAGSRHQQCKGLGFVQHPEAENHRQRRQAVCTPYPAVPLYLLYTFTIPSLCVLSIRYLYALSHSLRALQTCSMRALSTLSMYPLSISSLYTCSRYVLCHCSHAISTLSIHALSTRQHAIATCLWLSTRNGMPLQSAGASSGT